VVASPGCGSACAVVGQKAKKTAGARISQRRLLERRILNYWCYELVEVCVIRPADAAVATT